MNVDAFSTIPEDPLKHILGYVSEPRALMACERTCTRFRRILSDDSLWRHCKGADGEKGGSYRENAFIRAVLLDIRPKQRLTSSITLSVVSPESVRSIIDADLTRMILQSAGGYIPLQDFLFHIRGDALGLALDVVEGHIYKTLVHAKMTAIHAARRSNDYPEVFTSDLELVERIRLSHTDASTASFCIWGRRLTAPDLMEQIEEAIEREWDETERVQLARRLANRAGVVKISNEAMHQVCKDIILWLVVLLRKPMVIHEKQLWQKQVKFDSEEMIDLWHDIPPAIRTVGDTGTEEIHCVVVPDQIADSAKDIGLPTYGGGNGWALSENQTLEEATNAAKERYMIQAGYASSEGEDEMSISSIDSEFESLSDTDEDRSSYSVYEDDECPEADAELERSWLSADKAFFESIDG